MYIHIGFRELLPRHNTDWPMPWPSKKAFLFKLKNPYQKYQPEVNLAVFALKDTATCTTSKKTTPLDRNINVCWCNHWTTNRFAMSPTIHLPIPVAACSKVENRSKTVLISLTLLSLSGCGQVILSCGAYVQGPRFNFTQLSNPEQGPDLSR